MPNAGKIIDSGTLTAAASSGIYTDASKAWVVNAYVNAYLYLPKTGSLLLILSNTATTITAGGVVVGGVSEAYHIRENASNPQVIPTTATLPVLTASGASVAVSVALT